MRSLFHIIYTKAVFVNCLRYEMYVKRDNVQALLGMVLMSAYFKNIVWYSLINILPSASLETVQLSVCFYCNNTVRTEPYKNVPLDFGTRYDGICESPIVLYNKCILHHQCTIPCVTIMQYNHNNNSIATL